VPTSKTSDSLLVENWRNRLTLKAIGADFDASAGHPKGDVNTVLENGRHSQAGFRPI
jgi:hypothetical protein